MAGSPRDEHAGRVHYEHDSTSRKSDTAGETAGAGSSNGTLYQRTRRVLVRVVVLLRLVAIAPQISAIVAALHTHGYAYPGLAVAAHLVLAGWWLVFPVVVLRRDTVPGWALVTDVTIVASCVIAVGYAARVAFLSAVIYSDLESVLMVTVVTLAMNTRPKPVVLGGTILAIAHVTAEIPAMAAVHANIIGTVSDLGWMAGAGLVSGMLVYHVRTASRYLDTASQHLLAQREQFAAEQARAEERRRAYQEQARRYRALHDGPMNILNAVGGRGPLAHPNENVRRQCAIGANLLRGLIPDGPDSALTDLSLALIMAGTDCAMRGLRVEYQFSDLPTDLSPDLVEALSGASREALNNVAAHADVDKAWLTALATSHSQPPAVIVAIVDQGKGFDPSSTPFGRGLNGSVIDRMTEVGGTATVDSYVGQGTRIELRWPR